MGIDSQGIYPGPLHLVTELGFLPQNKERKNVHAQGDFRFGRLWAGLFSANEPAVGWRSPIGYFIFRSFSAKEPYNQWFFCEKCPAT